MSRPTYSEATRSEILVYLRAHRGECLPATLLYKDCARSTGNTTEVVEDVAKWNQSLWLA